MDNENTKVKTTGEMSMSLYDINKNLISQLPKYNRARINDLEDRINKWDNASKYFMMLCNDIHYYTVLSRTSHDLAAFPDLGQAAVQMLLDNGYTIHADEECSDGHFEIWVKQEEETYAFLLFPYDEGVVNFG